VTGGTETDDGVELIIALFTFLMALPLVMAWLEHSVNQHPPSARPTRCSAHKP
jgi:hypothetical protein